MNDQQVILFCIHRFISNDVDDLCPQKEVFLILKKELSIADDYRFTDKQKNEVYNLLNCTDTMRQKRQIPYKRLLQVLSKTFVEQFCQTSSRTICFSPSRPIPIPKERPPEPKAEKKEELKPITPPRRLDYVNRK